MHLHTAVAFLVVPVYRDMSERALTVRTCTGVVLCQIMKLYLLWRVKVVDRRLTGFPITYPPVG